MMLGVIGCAALSLPATWIGFLAVFVIAKIGYNASLIFMILCCQMLRVQIVWIWSLLMAMHGDI